LLRRPTFVTTKVGKIIFLVETVRTKKSNGVRFLLWIYHSTSVCRIHKIHSLLYRYFQFYVLPYRQSERTECFLKGKRKEIAAAFPPRTDISSNVCFYPLSTSAPTAASRSMCFSERFYGEVRKLSFLTRSLTHCLHTCQVCPTLALSVMRYWKSKPAKFWLWTGQSKTKIINMVLTPYLRQACEGGHRGKYFPRRKGALFTLALEWAKVKAIAAWALKT